MKQLITVMAVFFSATVFGQSVGIGTTTPDPNAQLDVSSSNKGILIPRMTLAQRNTIPGITLGLMIYQTDNNPGFYVNKSSSFAFNWVPITEGKNLWSTSLGNSNYISNINTGNVGIGTTLPEMKFAVTNDDSAIALFNNSKTLATNIQSNIYLGTGRNGFGGYFTGAVRSTGTSASTARMSLLTGATTAGNNLQERVSIDNAGNMGVGTITPNYILDVNGRMRLRDKGPSLTAGIWHNKADNTEAAFIGMVNDSTYGFFGNGTSGNWRMGFDVKNAQMGIGLTDPTAPLSFANNIGNKIALWGDATGGHYGLGIQGSLLQIYSSANNADIALGYGSSNAFTENARFFGNGNMHLGKYGTWVTAADNKKINFGDGDYVYIGEIGADDRLEMQAGAFSFKNGDVFMGTTDFVKGAGYKLRVGGKIFSEEVRVQLQSAWPDYVFEKKYKKLSLAELEKYVDKNKHLPNVPSAVEVEKDGQHLGEIQRKMLEKIEELSLYIIELNKKVEEQAIEIEKLKKK
jgi:hypothetical protein